MRWIINYIKELFFCKHDFLVEEEHVTEAHREGTKVYMRCKKCGYHKKHWKYI